MSEILKRLGFNDFEIRLNHRKLLSAILEVSGIPIQLHTDTLVALDKLDKIGGKAVANEMAERGIPPKGISKAMSFIISVFELSKLTSLEKEKLLSIQQKIPSLRSEEEIYRFIDAANNIIDKNEQILERISGFIFGNENGETAVKEIRKILSLVNSLGGFRKIKINPVLARGLSYYTGAIMEIVLTGGDFAGSIGGGGRYDGLIGMFGKEQIPACGFSLGLERIIVVMSERNMFPEDLQNASADVMVTVWNEDSIGESLKLAGELRAEGLRALVYPEADKLGKQFKYASQINVPFVCVVGETELAENKVTLKNMQSGEQETISREDIVKKIRG